MDLTTKVTNVVLTKACSIKADGDSKESKGINLRVDFSGVTLADVFAKALAGTVIQWQNGQGRKNYTKWTKNQTVAIEFKAPAIAPTIDPETAMVAKLDLFKAGSINASAFSSSADDFFAASHA